MRDWRGVATALAACCPVDATVVCVTHAGLRRRYGAALARASQRRLRWIVVPPGESSKSLATAERIYHQLLQWNADRRTVLLALGGGVITDLTGYVAATYLRGIDWVALPTSLVAQLDSAIGGKVGVNLAQGKNLIGALWPARIVYNNLDTLQSLPAAGWRDGAVEAFKCGLIADRALVQLILSGDWRARIGEVITRAVRVKSRVVRRDLRDTRGIRAVLNAGHTVGHALEVWGKFSRLTHGEAVALGLLAEVRYAHTQDWCSRATVQVVADGVRRLGVSHQWPRWTAARWSRVLTHDKKRVNTVLQMPIVTLVGRAAVHEVPVAELAQWLSEYQI